MTDRKIPTPEEVRKEFEDFVRTRFGGAVQVVTHEGPFPFQEPPGMRQVPPRQTESPLKEFAYKPRDIKDHLDRFVIGQDDAKKALAIAICDHYNHIRKIQDNPDQSAGYAKQNVLLLGPTGVGKTYLVKQIARLIGVPFVKADATRFSETGYVGANVDDLIRDLVAQADGDIEAARFGIVYLDEADKLATSRHLQGRDVSGRGVQFGLLKLMEDSDVDLASGGDMRSQMQAFMEMQQKGRVERKVVNTRHILFILSGAFSGLGEITAARLNQKAIGFRSQETGAGTGTKGTGQAGMADTADFVEYGFEPEFIGRLPVRVSCHDLSEDDLFTILRDSEESILNQYSHAFDAYGIQVTFTEDSMRAIARVATRERTGARSLMSVCERVFRDFKFELPSTTVTELTVTRDMIEHPDRALAALLAAAPPGPPLPSTTPPDKPRDVSTEINRFAQSFGQEHGITLKFTRAAISTIALESGSGTADVQNYLARKLAGYEHGLGLVRQATGRSAFTIGRKTLLAPQSELESMIRRAWAAAAGQFRRESEKNSGTDQIV